MKYFVQAMNYYEEKFDYFDEFRSSGNHCYGCPAVTRSRWKIFAKATVNDLVRYNLGGKQWVDGRYVTISK